MSSQNFQPRAKRPRRVAPNRFCDQCGKAIPTLDSKFCPYCGNQLPGERDEPTQEPTSSTPREFAAGGGSKRIQHGDRKTDCIIYPVVVIVLLALFLAGVMSASGGDSPAASTSTATPKPTATPTITIKSTLENKYGIRNEIRAGRICKEFTAMFLGVSDGTHSYAESRELMQKMYSLADPPITSSIRTPTKDMLSAWTRGDLDGWLTTAESFAHLCADVAAFS